MITTDLLRSIIGDCARFRVWHLSGIELDRPECRGRLEAFMSKVAEARAADLDLSEEVAGWDRFITQILAERGRDHGA